MSACSETLSDFTDEYPTYHRTRHSFSLKVGHINDIFRCHEYLLIVVHKTVLWRVRQPICE